MATETLQPAGQPAFSSLEQLLSYNDQPRAVFTRLAMGGDRSMEGEIGCFEMPLVLGGRLELGRYDPDTDGSKRKDKIVLSMADRRGLSRSHGWLECHEGRFLVVWPVTEKEGFPTWVNGELIQSSTRLCTGDRLGFGAISGKPIVEFDCQIVNVCAPNEKLPGSFVGLFRAESGSFAPIQEGNSRSVSPDILQPSQAPSFDNELSNNGMSKTDDATLGSDHEVGADPQRPNPNQSDVLERALAVLNKQSDTLERTQQQLAETKLELKEKEELHERELSARTSLSNEAAGLRGEIATLRAFLAEQADAQVFQLSAAHPAHLARQPSSSTASEPASPQTGATRRPRSADSSVQDFAVVRAGARHCTARRAVFADTDTDTDTDTDSSFSQSEALAKVTTPIAKPPMPGIFEEVVEVRPMTRVSSPIKKPPLAAGPRADRKEPTLVDVLAATATVAAAITGWLQMRSGQLPCSTCLSRNPPPRRIAIANKNLPQTRHYHDDMQRSDTPGGLGHRFASAWVRVRTAFGDR